MCLVHSDLRLSSEFDYVLDEVDPLLCSCGAELKIVSIITDLRVDDRILRHLESPACKALDPFEPRPPRCDGSTCMRRSTWCSWPPLGQRPRLPPHNMHVPRIRFSPLSPVAFQSSESFGATESNHPWPVPARQIHLSRKNSLAPPTPSR